MGRCMSPPISQGRAGQGAGFSLLLFSQKGQIGWNILDVLLSIDVILSNSPRQPDGIPTERSKL